MKLKKGSQAAKDFMSKIRAKKGKTKNIPDRSYKKITLDFEPIQKISGTKKTTFKPSSKKKAVKKASSHKDTKSHNVNVSVISGITTAKTALKKQYENLQGRLLSLKKAIDKRKVRKQITLVKKKFEQLNKF